MRIFIIFVFGIFLASCSTSKKVVNNNPIFTEDEISLIKSGKINEPMRVLQINQFADSLIL